MKNIFKPAIIPALTLISGALGLGLQFWLLRTGVDEKGLLVQSHPAGTLLFILTALVLAALFLSSRNLPPMRQYSQLFPRGVLSSIGCVAAAAGILWVNVRELTWQKDTITLLTLILGLLAAFSLAMVAWKRKGCARPSCLFHALVTVYLMFHLVSQYRLWSSESQMLIYFFPLMASIFLMLSAYHSAVLDLRKESRSGFVFFSQAALFFCMVSIYSQSWLFYATMSLWLATGLCSLQEEAPREEA